MKLQERAGKKRTLPKTDSLIRRLTAYSATAGAALLVVPVADAAIQNITTFSYDGNTFGTTPPDVVASSLNTFFSILFTGAPAGSNYGFFGRLSVKRSTNATVSSGIANGGYARIKANYTSVLATNSNFGAVKLSFDAPIAGTARNFLTGTFSLANKYTTSKGSRRAYGSFLPNGSNAAKSGYIGFRYIGASQTYYGWLRVKVVNDGTGSPVEVMLADKNGDGIYGAVGLAGDNIRAGEIAGVAEPSVAAIGGLGLLALGATGLRELRRRRQKTAN